MSLGPGLCTGVRYSRAVSAANLEGPRITLSWGVPLNDGLHNGTGRRCFT